MWNYVLFLSRTREFKSFYQRMQLECLKTCSLFKVFGCGFPRKSLCEIHRWYWLHLLNVRQCAQQSRAYLAPNRRRLSGSVRHRNAGTKILGVPHGSLAPAQAPSGGHGRAWAGLASPASRWISSKRLTKTITKRTLIRALWRKPVWCLSVFYIRQWHAALPWAWSSDALHFLSQVSSSAKALFRNASAAKMQLLSFTY